MNTMFDEPSVVQICRNYIYFTAVFVTGFIIVWLYLVWFTLFNFCCIFLNSCCVFSWFSFCVCFLLSHLIIIHSCFQLRQSFPSIYYLIISFVALCLWLSSLSVSLSRFKIIKVTPYPPPPPGCFPAFLETFWFFCCFIHPLTMSCRLFIGGFQVSGLSKYLMISWFTVQNPGLAIILS